MTFWKKASKRVVILPCERCGDPGGSGNGKRPARLRLGWEDADGVRRVGQVCQRCYQQIKNARKRLEAMPANSAAPAAPSPTKPASPLGSIPYRIEGHAFDIEEIRIDGESLWWIRQGETYLAHGDRDSWEFKPIDGIDQSKAASGRLVELFATSVDAQNAIIAHFDKRLRARIADQMLAVVERFRGGEGEGRILCNDRERASFEFRWPKPEANQAR